MTAERNFNPNNNPGTTRSYKGVFFQSEATPVPQDTNDAHWVFEIDIMSEDEQSRRKIRRQYIGPAGEPEIAPVNSGKESRRDFIKRLAKSEKALGVAGVGAVGIVALSAFAYIIHDSESNFESTVRTQEYTVKPSDTGIGQIISELYPGADFGVNWIPNNVRNKTAEQTEGRDPTDYNLIIAGDVLEITIPTQVAEEDE